MLPSNGVAVDIMHDQFIIWPNTFAFAFIRNNILPKSKDRLFESEVTLPDLLTCCAWGTMF
jgi:hypothetical protein